MLRVPLLWGLPFIQINRKKSPFFPAAEESVKDRIANIARSKLKVVSKESQLRLERKKRAAMFAQMLKSGGDSEATDQQPKPPCEYWLRFTK